MTAAATYRELFAYSDWGRDKLLNASTKLSDEQLDRAFEIGPGTLRATLQHLYAAERIWHERWQGQEFPQFPQPQQITALTDLATAWRALADIRNRFIDGLPNDPFDRLITYTKPSGETYTRSLGDLLLHVCNHGVHHRAQALNLLRRAGGKPMSLDQLYMRAELPTLAYSAAEKQQLNELGFAVSGQVSPPAELDPRVLRRYFAYCDWANARTLDAAAALTDEQLDREHDVGLKRLRKTMLHICDAEVWWFRNWTIGPREDFEQLAETTSIAELREIFEESNRRRDAYLSALRPSELLGETTAQVKAGVRPRFRLGETILELLEHGTHHRAQALNMLRHSGAEPPSLNYTDYLNHCAGSS